MAAGHDLAHGLGDVGVHEHLLHLLLAQKQYQQREYRPGQYAGYAAGHDGQAAAAADQAHDDRYDRVDQPGEALHGEHLPGVDADVDVGQREIGVQAHGAVGHVVGHADGHGLLLHVVGHGLEPLRDGLHQQLLGLVGVQPGLNLLLHGLVDV